MKIAIIGAHYMETKALYDNLKDRWSGAELVGCADPDRKAAEHMAAQYGIRAMDIEEILNDPEIRVVLNATFPEHTEMVTESCLKAGKHVFTTRQIANTFEKGRYFYELAKEKNVRLTCGPDCIFGAGIQTARYMMDHGAIGKVHSLAAVLARDNHFIAEVLPHVMQPGGGVLYDMSGYFLLPMLFLLGPVRRVSAFGQKGDPEHIVKKVGSEHRGLRIHNTEYEVLSILLEFENDLMATLHLNSNSIFQKDLFQVAGEKGVLDVGYPHEFDAPVDLITYGMQKMRVPHRFGIDDVAFGVGVAELAWAVEAGRDARVSSEMALHDLEILHGVEESIRTGEVYEMTTTMERPVPLEEGYFGRGFWATGEETALSLG